MSLQKSQWKTSGDRAVVMKSQDIKFKFGSTTLKKFQVQYQFHGLSLKWFTFPDYSSSSKFSWFWGDFSWLFIDVKTILLTMLWLQISLHVTTDLANENDYHVAKYDFRYDFMRLLILQMKDWLSCGKIWLALIQDLTHDFLWLNVDSWLNIQNLLKMQ